MYRTAIILDAPSFRVVSCSFRFLKNRDGSVGISTWVGWLRNRDSIPGRGSRFLSILNSSGLQPEDREDVLRVCKIGNKILFRDRHWIIMARFRLIPARLYDVLTQRITTGIYEAFPEIFLISKLFPFTRYLIMNESYVYSACDINVYKGSALSSGHFNLGERASCSQLTGS
jgi:hypothetical protein